jgi:hypothetical protein
MRGIPALVVAASAAAVLMFRSWPGEWAGRAEGATSSEQKAGSSGGTAGTRLHDGAKDFGEGLLGGVKFVGRTVISPFTGTTSKGRLSNMVRIPCGDIIDRAEKSFPLPAKLG